MLLNFFKKRRKKWYQNNRWHFVLDISLSILTLLILTIFVSLNLFRPSVDSSNPFLRPKEEIKEPIIIEDPLKSQASVNKNVFNQGENPLVYLELINTQDDSISNLKIELFSINANIELSDYQYSLEYLEGLEEVQLDLTPKLVFQDPLNRYVKWGLKISFQYLDKEFNQEFDLPDLFYNSITQVSAKAFYHNSRGDQLGIGPIPPIVGIPTSYFVFFDVDNLGNDLNNFALSINLANNTVFTKQASLLAGNYSYNNENNRIIWQVNQVDKRGGNYQAVFELQITPQLSDIGKNLILIDSMNYTYQDNLTKQQISGNLGSVDNSLEFDFINKNQGIVRE